MDFSFNNSRNENLLNSSFKKKKKKKESISKQDIRILYFYEFKNEFKSISNSNNSTVLEKRIKTVLLFFDKWDS